MKLICTYKGREAITKDKHYDGVENGKLPENQFYDSYLLVDDTGIEKNYPTIWFTSLRDINLRVLELSYL